MTPGDLVQSWLWKKLVYQFQTVKIAIVLVVKHLKVLIWLTVSQSCVKDLDHSGFD